MNDVIPNIRYFIPVSKESVIFTEIITGRVKRITTVDSNQTESSDAVQTTIHLPWMCVVPLDPSFVWFVSYSVKSLEGFDDRICLDFSIVDANQPKTGANAIMFSLLTMYLPNQVDLCRKQVDKMMSTIHNKVATEGHI